jgi:hypothetical protein
MNILKLKNVPYFSIIIATYIFLASFIISLILKSVSVNTLSLELTLADLPNAESHFWFILEILAVLLLINFPLVFYKFFKDKILKEWTSFTLYNLLFILFPFVLLFFNFNRFINIFSINTNNYNCIYTFELDKFSRNKIINFINQIGVVQFSHKDLIVILLVFLILILIINCLIIFVFYPYLANNPNFKFNNSKKFIIVISSVVIFVLCTFCFFYKGTIPQKNTLSNTSNINNQSTSVTTKIPTTPKKEDDGISYSGTLDNGSFVSFKIKMIGEKTYLISNGNQSLMTLLSNGRYLIEDGPMVGMTLDPSAGGCTIYAVDGTMVDILLAQ